MKLPVNAAPVTRVIKEDAWSGTFGRDVHKKVLVGHCTVRHNKGDLLNCLDVELTVTKD